MLGINDNAATVLKWSQIRADHPERTGARMLRTGLRWDFVQPRPGVWDWGPYDRLFALEAERRLEILPVLNVTPAWAGPAWNALPADPGAYARFAAAVARRYGPDGQFWREHPKLDGRLAAGWLDVWNEPYLNAYSDNDVNPAQYAQLVEAVGIAVHRANPAERLLMEANTYYETPAGALSEDWIDQLYQAVPSLNEYFDAASVHPYCADPTVPVSQTEYSCQRVQVIHDELAANGAGSKPLWATEFGWSTCGEGGTYPGCVSYQDQAMYLQQMLSYLAAQPYIGALFPYSYANLSVPSVGLVDTYGLMDWGNHPKPAYAVWLAFTRRAEGKR